MFTLPKALAVTAAMFAIGAQAATVNYSWEDGGAVLGQFDAGQTMQYSNTNALARSGSSSLLIEDLDNATSGTPQGYVAWVNGLTDGDTIDASFWAYDTSAGTSPSVRIWAHYTDDAGDVDSYAGSAGGNTTYSDGLGWSQLSHSWVFDSDSGTRDGLMIEVRFYDGSSATTGAILLDDLYVNTSAGTITTPYASAVPVPAAAWLFGSAIVGLLGARRARKA